MPKRGFLTADINYSKMNSIPKKLIAHRPHTDSDFRSILSVTRPKWSILQKVKNRDLEEKKAVLLAKLEEAELGERAALLEASRIKGDNEGLKVSQVIESGLQ